MRSPFHSKDVSISDIFTDISKGYVQLADFQRGWVWEDHRIRAIIASISNSYPVGSVIFLEYGGDNVGFKYQTFPNVELMVRPDKLVLDGHHRLASLYCAMGCSNPVETSDNKIIIDRFYYMDILKSLDMQVDRMDAILPIPEDRMIKSDFGRKIDLDLSSREKEFKNHMFPLNIVYDHTVCANWQFDYLAYHGYDREISERYSRFNNEILATIQTYKIPVITLDKSTTKEAVCQIFENANACGTALTIFELLAAAFASEDFDLRDDWEDREETFADNPVIAEVTSTDFLSSMMLISSYKRWKYSGSAVSCKKKDILNLSLEEYKQNAMILEKAFVDAANFLKEQHIFAGRDLPYLAQLIPLAATFALLGDAIHDSTVKCKILRWYWCGVFGEMYSGANETRYALDVTGLMAWIKEAGREPDTVNKAYFHPIHLLFLQPQCGPAYKGLMALLLKAGCVDFVSDIPKKQCERDDKIESKDLNKYICSHLINREQMRLDNFNGYYVEKAKWLLDLISDAMGKTLENRDSEETIAAFGKSLC